MKKSRGHLTVVSSNEQPPSLGPHDARRIAQELAQNSSNVAVLPHAQKRKRERRVSLEDILRVLRSGTVTEGPYISTKSGLWRFNMTGRSAGDEVTCVVEIEWKTKLLVVTVF